MKYCTECGTKLESRPLEHEGIVPFCPQCGEYRFPMYNVAVSMIVVNEENGKLLLVKQYGKDFFRLVAGYVNLGESLEAAVVRELKETYGLGANALTDHEFLAQFLNGTGEFAVATHGADAFSEATGSEAEASGEATEVDALTGATVTSKAVVRAINSAIAYVTGADVDTAATSWGG